MTLVPVKYSLGGRDLGTAPLTLAIDPERRRLMGLKTALVRRSRIESTIRTSGRVAFDETRVVTVQPRFEGYVERLEANFTGKFVRRGQALASIYSPELYATQQEYLLALRSRKALADSGLPDASDAARERLRLFGIAEAQIDALARAGKPLRAVDLTAPISGFVTVKNITTGARVGPGQPIFEIADVSSVWVLADIYEYELPRLRLGQAATLTLASWPGRSWHGRVGYISPTVDDKTRTVRARIEVRNPRAELKPEMFADVIIAAAARTALVVPEDAVIDTGIRTVVFVTLGDGRLQPRAIEIGYRASGLYEVRSGLSEGESVATGASFLLDSESKLRSAISEMAPVPVPVLGAAPPSGGPDGGHR